MLREWARLSWLLPREQRAGAFAATWLLKRSLLGWRCWLMQKRKWELLGDSLAARWTNLHLTAAWQAWRAWVQGRQEKARLEHTVARRWNNLHLAAAFQAWVELVQVRAQICLSLNDNFSVSVRHRSATDQTRKVLPNFDCRVCGAVRVCLACSGVASPQGCRADHSWPLAQFAHSSSLWSLALLRGYP